MKIKIGMQIKLPSAHFCMIFFYLLILLTVWSTQSYTQLKTELRSILKSYICLYFTKININHWYLCRYISQLFKKIYCTNCRELFQNIYLDNWTNFVATQNKLIEFKKLISDKKFKDCTIFHKQENIILVYDSSSYQKSINCRNQI